MPGLDEDSPYKCGHRTLTITRKGGKVVTIPLAPSTARAIDLATGERCDGTIFLTGDGRRLDRHGAGRIVRKVARRAGITKPVGPHTLRHAFITAAFRCRGCCAMCRRPLYERWPDPAKEEDDPDRWLWSATIVTHHATWLAGVMNDRTPVILPPDRIDAWLDPELTDKIAALKLISGIEYEPLQVRAVSTAVNKTGRAGSRGPELIEPIGEHGDQPLQLVTA